MKHTTRLLIITGVAISFASLLALAGEPDTHIVEQKDRSFSQTEITIKPGERVVFTNCDEVTHNVFSTSGVNPFNIKVQTPGNSSTVTFTNEGVSEVRCAIHPKMKLTVTVKGDATRVTQK